MTKEEVIRIADDLLAQHAKSYTQYELYFDKIYQFSSHTWVVGYRIVDKDSPEDIIDGSVDVIVDLITQEARFMRS